MIQLGVQIELLSYDSTRHSDRTRSHDVTKTSYLLKKMLLMRESDSNSLAPHIIVSQFQPEGHKLMVSSFSDPIDLICPSLVNLKTYMNTHTKTQIYKIQGIETHTTSTVFRVIFI